MRALWPFAASKKNFKNKLIVVNKANIAYNYCVHFFVCCRRIREKDTELASCLGVSESCRRRFALV